MIMVINKYHYGGKVPKDAVNIMRGSIFGNPFKIGEDGDREQVIAKFKKYLWNKIKTDDNFMQEVKNLNGKILCCCCAPRVCHGDVLEAASKWLNNKLGEQNGN